MLEETETPEDVQHIVSTGQEDIMPCIEPCFPAEVRQEIETGRKIFKRNCIFKN